MSRGPSPRQSFGDPIIRRIRFREPFSGFSHLFGAALSLAGLALLHVLSRGRPWHLTGFWIYGTCMFLLYTASAVYHLSPVSPERVKQLLVWDHVGIHLLIAGSYTPICLVSLRGPWGWSLLSVVWGLALIGISLRLAWKEKPQWLSLLFYLVMGWLCVVALVPLFKALPGAGILWLGAGGLVYSIGAVVFALERPRLWPGIFGAHDLWHIFVLAGSACHFVVMVYWVAPRP